ncbi:DNA-3-methyladenine glycosylase 1 [Candidatus Hartigia pinicola]|nr:DNA-3-methyladenine glycosylase 1 [Candidatus Hartigia pinicola]
MELLLTRCRWVNRDPKYISYHDNEWGRPSWNSRKLFEILCLEGQQAGLSWYVIFKKREKYRELFHDFKPEKIVCMTSQDIKRIIKNPGIIRHRSKLNSIITNAKVYLEMAKNGEDFSDFVWGFVNHQPIVNRWETHSQIPTCTLTSEVLFTALKKRGFKFIGSITCYSFMQAIGMINDHLISCFQYDKLQ